VLLLSTTLLAVAAPGSEAVAGPADGGDEPLDASVRDASLRDASARGAPRRDASARDTSGGASSACPSDMVEVRGSYCPELEQKCLRWLAREAGGVERCAQFAPSGPCKKPVTKKHFCIDKYEYPNKVGENPVVMKTWTEAQEICRSLGKRLCTDSEWTLACEGKQRLPYPYGRRRDAKACNIDRKLPQVNQKALADPRRAPAEVARLWQGEPSGARKKCVSPYGVYDMTGNVDEWVVNESGKPYRSGSKGGYWGPVRARCRPMTTAHHETFPFYQTGFRCCADVQKL